MLNDGIKKFPIFLMDSAGATYVSKTSEYNWIIKTIMK